MSSFITSPWHAPAETLAAHALPAGCHWLHSTCAALSACAHNNKIGPDAWPALYTHELCNGNPPPASSGCILVRLVSLPYFLHICSMLGCQGRSTAEGEPGQRRPDCALHSAGRINCQHLPQSPSSFNVRAMPLPELT